MTYRQGYLGHYLRTIQLLIRETNEWLISEYSDLRGLQSMELSTISLIQWSRPRASVEPMYIPDASTDGFETFEDLDRTGTILRFIFWSSFWHRVRIIIYWSEGYRYSQSLVCRGLDDAADGTGTIHLGWFSHSAASLSSARIPSVLMYSWQFLPWFCIIRFWHELHSGASSQ